ncbi:MAG: hypothetical protein HQL64_14380 [Magnetococcales bacterium]|nr:hypothetical protein [Magnetococcales bacterium]
MSDHTNIQGDVLKILAKYVSVQMDKVEMETTLLEVGVGSLDAVEILFALEDHFDITIPDPASIAQASFGSVVSLVQTLVEQKRTLPSS